MENNDNKDIYSIYHESSKNRDKEFNDVRDSTLYDKIYFKRYPRLESIDLAETENHSSLDEIIANRSSEKNYSGEPITLDSISDLLAKSCGIKDNYEDLNQSRRTYPSAGARYPTETYIIVLNGDKKISEGLYHYNVKNNSLELLRKGEFHQKIKDFLIFSGIDVENASMAILLTSIFKRSTMKYDERGYRYSLIETGHIGQNIYLVSEQLDLSCCAIGGFKENEVKQFLRLEGSEEEPIYMFIIGDKK